MNLSQFIIALKKDPKAKEISMTIQVVDNHYKFTLSAFTKGDVKNNPEENNSSCMIFAFAKLLRISEYFSLAYFGKYYFEDVLGNPHFDIHLNIRDFMKTG